MAASDLQIHISPQHDCVIVALVGEARLDFGAADQYIRAVLAHKPRLVIVDAAQLTFISSVGMSLLMNLQRALERAGGAMKLRSLQPHVRGVLAQAHVLQMFDVMPEPAPPTV